MRQHKLVATLIFENGANLQSSTVGSFLCTATQRKDVDMLNDLLSYGVDINPMNGYANTMLHVSMSDGLIEIVKYLWDHGADMNKIDCSGCTQKSLVGACMNKYENYLKKTQSTYSHLCLSTKDSFFL